MLIKPDPIDIDLGGLFEVATAAIVVTNHVVKNCQEGGAYTKEYKEKEAKRREDLGVDGRRHEDLCKFMLRLGR